MVLDVTCFLLKQGLSFLGNNEFSNSLNKGNFLELLKWHSLQNEEVWKAINHNAPGINQMAFPKIQKELQMLVQRRLHMLLLMILGIIIFPL